LGYTSSGGAYIGATLSLINYNFLSNPCQNIMTLRAALETAHARYDLSYDIWFPQTIGGSVSVLAEATTLNRLYFFGYGNETTVDHKDLTDDKYLVNEQLYQIAPKYSISVFENTLLWGMAALRYIETDPNPARDTTFLRRRHQYGVGTQTTAQLSFGIAFDSRDEPRAATKGIYAGFESHWTPEILDNSYAYTRLHADIRAYLSANILTPMTLALRIGADKLFGEHPFYESAFIGGETSLRGYYRDRFTGEASYLGTAELRVTIASLNVLVPSTMGLHLFADAGRVYVDNDFSNVWHTSFGGGIWVAPVSSEHTIAFTIARSPEATQYYLTTGFAF
jgi:outer membrane protein assembly factor BamA